MAHHIRIDPKNVNITGVDNLDSTILSEFTFHHGHVEQAITSKKDLKTIGINPKNIPNDVSQVILITSTFQGVLPSGYLKNKIVCQPLLRGFSDSITRGDSVIYTKIGDIFFYLGPLNTKNNPNYSPNQYYNPNLNTNLNKKISIDDRKDKPDGYNVNYRRLKVNKANKKIMYDLDSPFGTRVGDIDSEAELESRHTDLALEGRHNNSIQLGSRFLNPYITIKNNNTIKVNQSDDGEETLSNNGSIIGLLSLGSTEQFFSGYNLLSSDKRIGEEYQSIQEGQYPGYRINFGNDEIGEPREDVFNSEFGKLQESANNQSEFDQIIMFSDRITFDAQKNDLTMAAYRNINLGAGRNFTITNKGFSVIESENIYLGKTAKNKSEPMVLGEELRKMLEDITKILKNAHALVQGVPVPLTDALGAPLNRSKSVALESPILTLTEIVTQLESRTDLNSDDGPNFMSHHHYIETNRLKPTQE
jgi:hypothetical protein